MPKPPIRPKAQRSAEPKQGCDDAQLVALLQAKQAQAVELLLERYHAPLLAYAYRLLADRQTAEDVVQETLISLLQSLDKLREPAKLKSYLYRMATHRCRDQQRRPARREVVTDQMPDTETSDPDYAERCFVSALLKMLPPQQREVLVLRFYEDMDLGTIAETLGIPVGTVKSRLHHALQQIKKHAVMQEQQGKAGVLAHEP